jgi:CheY-like chemotaxis protein
LHKQITGYPANGQDAVDIRELWRPCLIWMDMRMPVMDGAEATRRIRASAEGQSATIIALTASSIGEEPAQILDAGCNDLLHKPVLEEELFAAMEKHMGARFIFEAEEPPPPPAVSERVQSEALQAQPAALRESLEQALVQLDHEAVVNALGQVDDAQVAKALGVLANDFQYDNILQLLRKGSP